MTNIETSPLTRKLGAFVALSEAELGVLERLHRRRKVFVAGRDLVRQGQSEQAAYILAAGWVVSYKIQPDGVDKPITQHVIRVSEVQFLTKRDRSQQAAPAPQPAPPLMPRSEELGAASGLEGKARVVTPIVLEITLECSLTRLHKYKQWYSHQRML